MKKNKTKVYWITGASSGIGKAMAEQLHKEGQKLIVSARRTELLEEMTKDWDADSVMILPLDISKHETLEPAVEEAYGKWGRVDVLINNAGITQRAKVQDTDYAIMRKLIDTNLIGTGWLTHCVLVRMQKAGSGHLVAVSSIAAKLCTPLRANYCASKQGLEGWFNVLRTEVSPQIKVTIAVPCYVNTDISVTALKGDGSFYNKQDAIQATAIPPEQAAREILRGIKHNKREVWTGFTPYTRLAVFGSKWMPGLFSILVRKAKTV